jgi:hypothetical protein
MDTTLIGATLISLAMATALSVIVWRLLRDERRRSEARVAALADMAARSADPPPRSRPLARAAAAVDDIARDSRPSRIVDLPLRDTPAPPSSAPLFVHPAQASPWRRRAVIMAALGLASAAIVLFALTVQNERRNPAPGAVASAGAPLPLELLSLRDARDADTLTITGLVENPRNGVTLARISVTAFVFDRGGNFLTSGRALLDVTSLTPGDQSPFVVSVPLPPSAAVARYRVSFRGEDGRVISHVDKRQQGIVADSTPAAPPGT